MTVKEKFSLVARSRSLL